MARRKSASSPHRLATQMAELAFAAPQVVAHRTARMAAAGAAPSLRDQQEFARMGSEKVLAFYQSWAAMWTQAFASQVQMAQAMNAATVGLLSAGLAPVHGKAVSNARRLSRRRGK